MKKTQIALLISSVIAINAYADEKEIAELDEVLVVGSSFSQQIGTQKITEEQIKRRPTTNGNITDLLKSNPNVVFANNSELSTNAGEISPSEVSFHGEKYYQNNFTIDGVSNNDNVNPAVSTSSTSGIRPSGYEAYDLPSAGSQSFWLDTKLLKKVEAFDSNISAKYGNFTGGVVNVEIKDPDLERHSGSISYRTTRDSWAKFHVQDDKVDDFYKANRLDYQPEFTKHQYSVSVNQPLSDSTGLLFSYNRTESQIKYLHPNLYYLDNPYGHVTDDQKRVSETYLLKGVHFAENGDTWKATFIYSPHYAKYYKQDVVNGGYKNTGGGYSFNLDWIKKLDKMEMETKFAYKHTGNEVEHDADVYRRYQSQADTTDWSNGTYALYGGFGKFKTEKDTYTLLQNYKVNEFDWGNTQHNVIFGWQADLSQAKYERQQEAWSYYYSSVGNSFSCNGMNECINGKQYATTATAYPIKTVKVNDSNYGAYLEDRIRWKNLELNLGVRVDYNQFLKNINVAPRTSFSYDIFGDTKKRLFGGYNRYYATSMLAYKLREGIGYQDRWYRNASTDYQWVYRSTTSNSVKQAVSNLDTPYSDEFVAGVSQKFFGVDTTFKWVHRNARKQLSRTTIDGYYTLVNGGWNKADTVTLKLDKIGEYDFKYAKVDWGFSARYSRTKSSNTTYDATSLEDYLMAYYKGKIIEQNDLPSSDFSSKWGYSLDVNTEFPALRLSWDQRFSWVGKRNYIKSTNNTINCQYDNYASICGSLAGQDIDAIEYEDATLGRQFLVDWRFIYKQPIIRNQYLELTLDINNVFNSKAVATSSGSTTYYKMGRNFWLGASYNW